MPLTIVIPVSQADVSRLSPLVEVMEFLGGLQKHAILICSAPSCHQQASEAAGRLRTLCPNVAVESLPREPEQRGRFGAFNMIFRDSVEILSKRGNKNPWMWWEVDVTPIRAGYADRLELEYHQKGMPFMGVRRKGSDTIRGANGEKLDVNDPRVQGDYMVAVGIYPPNFKDYSVMYKYPDSSGAMPTDVVIRHEVNKHLHGTQLIGHHYKTCNYRREGGKIVCDDFELGEGFPSYAGAVNEMAFVVHGDKSGSLAALVLNEAPSNVTESGIQTQTTNTSSAEIATLKAENAELRKDIQKMQEQWNQKENSYAEEIEQLKEKLAAGGYVVSPIPATPEQYTPPDRSVTVESLKNAPTFEEKPLPSIEKVVEALKEAKKSVPLLDLAADFGCNKTALRALLESDPKIKIAPGGRGWVSLAA